MKILLRNSMIMIVLGAFALMSIASEDITTASSTSQTETQVEQVVDSSVFSGTYYGANGSILVLFENGKADYYYVDLGEVSHDNKWNYISEKNLLTIDMSVKTKNTYSVEATIENGNFYSMKLVGSGSYGKLMWDEEQFYWLSEKTNSYSVEQCENMISNSSENLDEIIATNESLATTPSPTPTPYPTKPPTVTSRSAQTKKTDDSVLLPDENGNFVFSSGNCTYGLTTRLWDGDSFNTVDSNHQFLQVYVVAINSGNSDEFISDWDFSCYADNTSCENAFIYVENYSSSVEISAGRQGEILFAFVVPKSADSIEIEFEENSWTDEKIVMKVK